MKSRWKKPSQRLLPPPPRPGEGWADPLHGEQVLVNRRSRADLLRPSGWLSRPGAGLIRSCLFLTFSSRLNLPQRSKLEIPPLGSPFWPSLARYGNLWTPHGSLWPSWSHMDVIFIENSVKSWNSQNMGGPHGPDPLFQASQSNRLDSFWNWRAYGLSYLFIMLPWPSS